MGKVKTEQIKRLANELIERFPKKFSHNFDENKRVVDALTQGTTIKVRNQIAGYITRAFSKVADKANESTQKEETK